MDWVKSVDWGKVTQVIINVTQAAALLVGGVWVYFNFIRSRTFARRAELDVKASVLSVEQGSVIRVSPYGRAMLVADSPVAWAV